MSFQIVLILGAGANIGKNVAKAFASQGFKVAIASRSPNSELSENADASFKTNLSDPSSVKELFASVKSQIGVPNVVIYNAAASTAAQDGSTSVSLSAFANDLAVNTTSLYAAAQEAVVGFESLPKDTLKTFIYTGNILNKKIMPSLITLGVGKSASAHLIEAASASYHNKGYRFYYADERTAEGGPVGGAISGSGAAQFYYDLAKEKIGGGWSATFVAGKGYKQF